MERIYNKLVSVARRYPVRTRVVIFGILGSVGITTKNVDFLGDAVYLLMVATGISTVQDKVTPVE